MLRVRWGLKKVGLRVARALVLALMTASAGADEMPANNDWTGALGSCADCWSLSAGVVALDRDIDDNVNVILVEPGTFRAAGSANFGKVSDDIPIVNVQDMSLDTEVREAFTIGRAIGRDWSAEVSGLHVKHEDELDVGMGSDGFVTAVSLPFDDSFKATPNSFLSSGIGADRARVAYKTRLYDL
ncbi:MAG: hypothetical protein ACE5JZ_09025 [Kiloniellales bacterium]